MNKHKILLVEDNNNNRVLATFLLEDAGLEVVPAVNGADALEKARSAVPDLILLDIQLPDIDGYGIVQKLKRDAALARIPVVAVSSYAMAGERKRALDLGCVGYIEKPIDTAKFASQVLSFLQRQEGV
jgi:two-component system, cell cycle response regulator DivK